MVPLWLGTELGGSLQEYGTSVAGNRARREFRRIMVPLWLGTELEGSFQEYGISVAGNRARREFTRIWYLCGREQS
jgi:hypothetical protein